MTGGATNPLLFRGATDSLRGLFLPFPVSSLFCSFFAGGATVAGGVSFLGFRKGAAAFCADIGPVVAGRPFIGGRIFTFWRAVTAVGLGSRKRPSTTGANEIELFRVWVRFVMVITYRP